MVLVPNNESFYPGASGSLVTNKIPVFRKYMDSVLMGGRSILIDLPAGKNDCPDSSCRFNPTYGQYMGATSAICRTCKGKGFLITPRQTRYKCNRRWTNQPMDRALTGRQNTEGGRIYGNFVRTKTHISSFNHISQSLGAEIDGVKVKLYEEPRKTGWNDENYYVIAWWQRANKKENG